MELAKNKKNKVKLLDGVGAATASELIPHFKGSPPKGPTRQLIRMSNPRKAVTRSDHHHLQTVFHSDPTFIARELKKITVVIIVILKCEWMSECLSNVDFPIRD